MFRTPFASAAAVLLPLAVSAQSTSGLTVNSLKTYAYGSMVSWTERDSRPADVPEVAAVDGMIFLDVRAVFDVPWTEDLSRLSISASDIVVILPDGSEIQSCCNYEYWGMMHMSGSGVSVSRPRDFPDEDADLYWHSIFLVPEGTPEVTLRLPADEGEPGFEGTIPVPPEVTVEQDAAMFADFALADPQVTPVLELEAGRDSRLVTSLMTAPPGEVFLDVEMTITPFSANEFDFDGRFYWHTYDFRLVGESGERFPLIGERFQDRILDSQFNSVAVGDDGSRRMIFLVPEAGGTARLLFGASEVATVTY